MKQIPVVDVPEQIRKQLGQMKYAENDISADVLMLCYLCGHTLHFIGREVKADDTVIKWDGEHETAAVLDAVLNGAAT